MRLRRPRTYPHVNELADYLADEFDHDTTTTEVVRNILNRLVDDIPDTFELIVDPPGAANWRLKPDRNNGRWALRMACYRYTPTRDDQARVDRINEHLRNL